MNRLVFVSKVLDFVINVVEEVLCLTLKTLVRTFMTSLATAKYLNDVIIFKEIQI